MHAEILSIGDEVISGRILDTNAQWLSQRSEEVGLRVVHHSAVGDDLDVLDDAFRQAIGRADVLLVSGGLGPTADDVTREALARAVGRPLVQNTQALEHIRELFARRKRPMPQRNELQALLPEGAAVIRNPHGTAPGIDLSAPRGDGGECRVICLPGVPAEIKEMWADSVGAILAGVNPQGLRIVHKQVKCFGAGESQIESMLPEGFLRQTDPIVGINASQTAIIFRIAAQAATEELCRAKIAPVVADIRQQLGRLVFGEDDDELESVVLRRLSERGQTLALADWGTGGLTAERLGAAALGTEYLGAVVAGCAAGFQRGLALAEPLLDCEGNMSQATAEALARACRAKFAADYGLAIGPAPRVLSTNAEPRSLMLALDSVWGAQAKALPYAAHPATLRVWTSKQALNMVRLALEEG